MNIPGVPDLGPIVNAMNNMAEAMKELAAAQRENTKAVRQTAKQHEPAVNRKQFRCREECCD